MGIVLEATDLPLQRRVAVKVMAPERAKSDEARKRFIREARAAARLTSEHVARLIDVGELDDGTPYLVMEYLLGSTLEQILARDGIPPIDVAVDWVLQALDGVAEAHRAGLVHRDLKPENLFLNERPGRQPIVKVLDFGAVKDLVTKGTKLTRTGSTMGSPAYMPPEQVRAEDIDQRADVWAMGVTLYELITGRLPFGGESVPQTLAAILRDTAVPLRSRRPDVPPDLEALVHCALSKDRSARYSSANEMLAALSVVRAQMPKTTRVTKTVLLNKDRSPQYPNPPPSRPDAFAETTDMHALVETDASRVRPRIQADLHPRPSFQPPAPNTKPATTRAYAFALVLAIVLAVLMVMGVTLALRSRREAASAPSATTTMPSVATSSPSPPRR